MCSSIYITIISILCLLSNADTWYVSSDGDDHILCGWDVISACSSIQWATLLAYNFDQTYDPEIYVYGQNLTNAKEANPDYVVCEIWIPLSYKMTVTFDSSIQTLSDWFDVEFCQQPGNSYTRLIMNFDTELTLNTTTYLTMFLGHLNVLVFRSV
eukprot:123512_1